MKRRIIALAATVLFLVPGSALAECAWVLWVTVDSPSGNFQGTTEPNAAFTTREECDALQKRATPDIEQKLKKQFPDGWVKVRCLPDTVDPRGPKGK